MSSKRHRNESSTTAATVGGSSTLATTVSLPGGTGGGFSALPGRYESDLSDTSDDDGSEESSFEPLLSQPERPDSHAITSIEIYLDRIQEPHLLAIQLVRLRNVLDRVSKRLS